MRPRFPPPPRKRRTRQHVLADLSVNHVERLIYRCGWVARRLNPDYGIDLIMETFTSRGEIENGLVLLQLKATDTLKRAARHTAIPVLLDARDVVFWLNEEWPGILIIYDAAEERAWWLHLQEALRNRGKRQWRPRGKLTVHVPLANRLDEAAIRHFAYLRDQAQTRMKEDTS